MYTTECLLDYGYIKNHYGLIVVDLSRQKELDAYQKGIQKIELVGQFKIPANVVAANESMFVLTILEKIRKGIKVFSQNCKTTTKDSKLSRSDSSTNKYAVKQIKIYSKKYVRNNIKIKFKKQFEDEKLTHNLLLTTRQKAKIRNTFGNNISIDIKLSKAQISKIIQ